MVDQDGGLMKPVMRKRSILQGEVWEWLIKHLPQGELEEVDLPRGEGCACRFSNFKNIPVLPWLLLRVVLKIREPARDSNEREL